jgi:competence protein ComEC
MAFIEKLPLAVAENLWLGGFQMMLLYIFIAMVSAWIILKRSLYLKMALLAMIILIVFDIGILIKRDHKKEFIVYNIPDASVYNFINGKSNCIFYSRSEEIKEAIDRFLKPYWLSKRLTECKLYNLDSIKTIKEKSLIKQKNFIGLEGLKFAFISKETDLEGLHGPKKLKLDYLILADNIKVNVKNLAQLFDFQSIILDSSNSYYYRKKLSRQLKKLGCNCYSVPEEGAFRVVFD